MVNNMVWCIIQNNIASKQKFMASQTISAVFFEFQFHENG